MENRPNEDNILNSAFSNLTSIEKYNCKSHYYKIIECIRHNQDSLKQCEIFLEKLGECIYVGMQIDEKKLSNIN
jgi:hypothetical protein